MEGAQKPRVLVIGLDGATFRIIRPMVEAGRLPALSRLIKNGSHGVLRSTIQPSSEQAWPTFMTGVQNGKHGIFGFVQRVPGSYEYQYTNASSLRARTLWRILSDHGRRVIVINVPMTYPPEPVNGVLIGGLMTPSERSRFTYPDGIYEEIRRQIGGYIINVDIETGRLKEAGERELLREIERMIFLRTAATKYLARTRNDWDLLTVVYAAADRVSHKFWKYMDENHPHVSEGKAGVIPKTYELLDQAIDELLQTLVDERTLVLLISDHGFGPLRKAFFLNQWLVEHGYMTMTPPANYDWRKRVEAGLNAGLRRAVRWLDKPWLSEIKRLAFESFPQLKGKLHTSMAYAPVDWSRTLAYGAGTMGNIYLNVRGREPAGIVEPGDDYEAIRARLIEDLRDIRDPDTRQPIFQAVYRREEIYHGSFLHQAPDIIGLLDPTYHIAAVDWRCAGGETIASVEDELLFVGDLTGQHDMEGILIASGPNVRAGAIVEGAGIVDIAPTILAYLGEPVPPDMDGRVLQNIFVTPLAFTLDSAVAPAPTIEAPAVPFENGYTPEESEEIAEHLRGLGYIQ